MIFRQAVVDSARSYLNVRWHHQGRNRAGVDCAGLIICVAQDLELAYTDIQGYPRTPDGKTLLQLLDSVAIATPVHERQIGDILVFQFQDDPQHMGIMTDRGVIHAYLPMYKVVEHRMDEFYWARKIVAVYSYAGVA